MLSNTEFFQTTEKPTAKQAFELLLINHTFDITQYDIQQDNMFAIDHLEEKLITLYNALEKDAGLQNSQIEDPQRLQWQLVTFSHSSIQSLGKNELHKELWFSRLHCNLMERALTVLSFYKIHRPEKLAIFKHQAISFLSKLFQTTTPKWDYNLWNLAVLLSDEHHKIKGFSKYIPYLTEQEMMTYVHHAHLEVPNAISRDTYCNYSTIKINSDWILSALIRTVYDLDDNNHQAEWIACLIRSGYTNRISPLLPGLSAEAIQNRSWLREMISLLPDSRYMHIPEGINKIISYANTEELLAFTIVVLWSSVPKNQEKLRLLNLIGGRDPQTDKLSSLELLEPRHHFTADQPAKKVNIIASAITNNTAASDLCFSDQILLIHCMLQLRSKKASGFMVKALMPNDAQQPYITELREQGYTCSNNNITDIFNLAMEISQSDPELSISDFPSYERHNVFYRMLLEAGLKFDKPHLEDSINTHNIIKAINCLTNSESDKTTLSRVIEALSTHQHNQVLLTGNSDSHGVEKAIKKVLQVAEEKQKQLDRALNPTEAGSSTSLAGWFGKRSSGSGTQVNSAQSIAGSNAINPTLSSSGNDRL